jgi:hypothetical protein
MADQKISQLTSATLPLAGTEVFPLVQGGVTVKTPASSVLNQPTIEAKVKAVTASGAVATLTASSVVADVFGGGARIFGVGANTSTAGTLKLITASTNASVYKENLVLNANGSVTAVDNIIIGTSGKGIDFSATPGTGTSELFDDYEEGTWTPTVAGDATGVINTESGQYTKVGNVVYFRCVFGVSTNFTSGSIGGLPFTCVVDNALTGLMGGSIVLTGSVTGAPIVATPLNGSTNINFYATASTGTVHSPNTVNATYRINGFYFT